MTGHADIPDLQQFEKGLTLTLDNAESLAEEAALLFEHGKVERAYVLATIAVEETGKHEMLVHAYISLRVEHPVVQEETFWPAFWKRFKSHRDKLSVPAAMNMLRAGNLPIEPGETVQRARQRAGDENASKMGGFYTGFASGKFVSPSEIIGSEKAREMVERARGEVERMREFERGVSTLVGSWSELDAEQLRGVIQIIERAYFGDSGL